MGRMMINDPPVGHALHCMFSESTHLDEPRLQHLLPAVEALHVGAHAAQVVDRDGLRWGRGEKQREKGTAVR